MQRLRWLMELLDRVSGPARRIVGSLGSVSSALKAVGQNLANIKAGIDIFTGFAGSVLGAVKSVGSLAFEAGKFAIEVGSFKENSLIAFETLLGSKQQAKELFDWAVKFARSTPFETKDVVDISQRLLTAGFKFNPNEEGVSEISVISKAIGDLAALKGNDKQVMDRVTMALGQIKSKGRLQGEELMQLAEAGVPTAKVYELLGERMGKTRAEVEKLQRAGKISSDEGIFAVVGALKETTSGGKLGTLMDKQSKTITGLLSTVKSAGFDLLVDIDTTAGFKQAKGFFGNLAKALDPERAGGKAIKARLEKFFDDLLGFGFGSLSGEGGEEAISDFILKLIDLVDAGWSVIKRIFTSATESIMTHFRELGGGDASKGFEVFLENVKEKAFALGGVIEKLVGHLDKLFYIFENISDPLKLAGDASKALGDLVLSPILGDKPVAPNPKTLVPPSAEETAKLAKALQTFDWKSLGFNAGADISRGMASGITSGSSSVSDAVEELAGTASGTLADTLEIESPSKVFRHLGLMSAAGMAQGLELGSSEVFRAANDNLAGASISGAGAGLRGAGGGRTVNAGGVTVNITIEGGEAAEKKDLARRVKDAALEAVAEAFERLGLEMGVEAA